MAHRDDSHASSHRWSCRAALTGLLLFACIPGWNSMARAQYVTNVVSSNFNGTSILAGSTIWFNSHIAYKTGPTNVPVTILIDNSIIQFSAGSTNYSLPTPNALITLDPAASAASSQFDAGTNTWKTRVPPAEYGDENFSIGFALPVTATIPGGVNPVSWAQRFSSNSGGVSLQWQWGAAVYTSFSTDYNALNVTPVHVSLHAGVPQAYSSFVTGGARGGGGSNFTGSWSGTGSVLLNMPVPVQASTWSSIKELYR